MRECGWTIRLRWKAYLPASQIWSNDREMFPISPHSRDYPSPKEKFSGNLKLKDQKIEIPVEYVSELLSLEGVDEVFGESIRSTSR